MASRPSSRNSPGWRQASSPAPVPPSRGGWRDHAAPDRPLRRNHRRLVRLCLALSALVGTAALLTWLLLWLAPPGPACLVLAGAGYETLPMHDAPDSTGIVWGWRPES